LGLFVTAERVMEKELTLRRCAAVLIEPCEARELDLVALLGGGEAVARNLHLRALAAHLDLPITLSASEVATLAQLSPDAYTPRANLVGIDEAALRSLHEKGLVFAQHDSNALVDADQRVRDTRWHPLSAVAHRHTRWSDVRTADTDPQSYTRSLSGLVDKLGQPPAATPQRGDESRRLALPAAAASPIVDAARRRATCRNFDRSRPLPLATAAALLHGVFGAQAAVHVAAGAEVLKKLSPSGGGLHPTEGYVLALDVQGVASGIWHYRARDHALDPMLLLAADELREFALHALAGQDWFGDAPLMVVHACRFGRSFWKYRGHAKAYRAVILDIGHLSQTAYLLATELGVGAFVTAAINEAQIEQKLGLDPMVEGPLAISGFGYRTTQQSTPEFDPMHTVWPQADPA